MTILYFNFVFPAEFIALGSLNKVVQGSTQPLSGIWKRRFYTLSIILSVFNPRRIFPQEVLWSIWGSTQTVWSLPLQNVTWHSGTWPYTMTPSIDQTLHQFANLLPNWTLLPILTLLPNFWGFHRTLQRVRLANRGRLLHRTSGPVPFGTCICSNVETILSWTCHVYGPFEFRTSLGTSFLLEQFSNVAKFTQCFEQKQVLFVFFFLIRVPLF